MGSAGTTTFVRSRDGLAGVVLDAATLTEDRHDGIGIYTKRTTDGVARHSTLFAETGEQRTRHAEQFGGFGRRQRLALSDNSNVLAASDGVESEEQLSTDTGGKCCQVEHAARLRYVERSANNSAIDIDEVVGVNGGHGRVTHVFNVLAGVWAHRRRTISTTSGVFHTIA